ncbi:MAG: CotH kinase family protein, partial [Clostridia bacterium]|nr:CotH kinase family protein [Clostridia bacterium]
FIELCNTHTSSISLDGLCLFYKTSSDKAYRSFDLGGVVLPAGGYYLIRCASASKYQDASQMLKIENFDASWDVTVDNKEITLVLAPAESTPDPALPAADVADKVSYFVASETFLFDTGYVTDMAKSKIAVRVALKPDSGYRVLNAAKQNSYTLGQIAPRSSKGANAFTKCMLNEVLFDHDPGYYDSSFNLALSASGDYKIYYTLDGSDPRTSSSRVLYSAPITLADTTKKGYGETTKYLSSKTGDNRYIPSVSDIIGATVVKACATDGTVSTEVYTSTYFVSSLMKTYNTTVLSFSLPKGVLCDDPGTTDGGEGGGFYTHYFPSTNDPNPRGNAVIEVFDGEGIRRGYSNVELSVSGHGSSGWHMKSLKIYFKGVNNESGGTDGKLYYDLFDGHSKNAKGQAITDFSRLLIRNSGNDCAQTYIRDAVMQRLSSRLNVDTQEYAPALVFFNGEFWGIYNVRERYSGDYVESHYGVEKDNVALIESDYSQVHTDTNADYIVTSGLDNDADPFNELVRWISNHDLSGPANYKYVTERLDIDSFIDMYIARIYFSSRDWPENNIKVWRNRAGASDRTKSDTKWHFTLLDMDFGLDFPDVDTGPASNWFGWINSQHCTIGRIMDKLIRNQSFKKQFLARFYEVVNEIYVPAAMEEELDRILDGRENIFQLQVDRWSKDGASWKSYRNGVALIRNFLQKRNNYVISYLCRYFSITEAYLMSISGNYIGADFLESRAVVSVDGSEIASGWTRKFDKTCTFTVEAAAKEGYTVNAILFTDYNGEVIRKEGTSATFTVSSSGTVSLETKRNSSSAVSLKVRPGISAAAATVFYLDESGNLYGWGSNVNNILGAGTDVVTKPKFIMDNVAMVSVCSSNDYENGNTGMVCAAVLTMDGEIYSIGGSAQAAGRSGNLTAWGIVEFEGDPVEISVGYDHLLILDKSGDLFGIGNNSYGQLGAENYGGSAEKFQKIASGATMISAGRRNTAYLDAEGNCYVLGDGRWHKYDDGVDNFATPYKLLSGVVYIESGEHTLVLVDESGNAYYAGWREIGSFTQGEGSHGAKAVLKGKNIVQASIMFSNMLMLSENGAVYVYGLDQGGAIGGAVTSGSGAVLIRSGVTQVAAGFGFSAFLMSDGTVRILGDNSSGQHANGTTEAVKGYSNVTVSK